jgi:hypothetical protein
MDLKQRKLNKSEWDSIEIPVSKNEKDVLNLIMNGYHNVNIKINNNNSIFTFIKIEYSEKMEDYLYNNYLRKSVEEIESYLRIDDPDYVPLSVNANIKINSADKIRLENNDEKTIKNADVYEFIILEQLKKFIISKNNNRVKEFTFHYYTFYILIKNNIERLNRHIISFTTNIIKKYEEIINLSVVIENGAEFIEKNKLLLKYADMTLYEHQKEIFTACKNKHSKLILYVAPTGTGKTLTPVSLSESYRIIFVCAARHVGLALARSAISVNKKIAFAFGCSSADDIRLHYFAAKEYSVNKRSGGIGKVDNSIGDKVEIMICDIRSYLPAMYYMLAFNNKEDIIMYWDEPTITLDYREHEFHSIIKKNWKENLIPNVVLSSATLPKLNELNETISDFKNKFVDSHIYNIVSHDCKKSIPIVNKDGYIVLPHYLSDNYSEILKIANHCQEHLTLLRYFDLNEIVEFITYINKNNLSNSKMKIIRHFETVYDVNMKNIKIYYINLLQNIKADNWFNIFNYFKLNRRPKLSINDTIDNKGNKITKTTSIGPGIVNNSSKSLQGAHLTRLASEQQVITKQHQVLEKSNGTAGVYVTTKDAYTLTDGPTIFISNDIEKICKFCIQQANIPSILMDDIMNKITYNNALNEKINQMEKTVDHLTEKFEKTISNNSSGTKCSRKINRIPTEKSEEKGEICKMTNEINVLRSMIKIATINETFVPNKPHHIKKWAEDIETIGAFTSNIDEHYVSEIMALHGVDDMWKILLMLGIGVFINHDNIRYTEIMKKLADEQKLYMIIASSDYIYGTNYQFCHAYLSKDLELTQEKIIQAMGRVGRNNIQQNYTIRFRDDKQILKLFTSETDKPEIINMNILFNTENVKFIDGSYVAM